MQKKRIVKDLNFIFKLVAVISVVLSQVSCKKLVEVDPPINSTTGANVYTDNATAAAVLTGIYAKISTNSFANNGGLLSVSLFPGLSADEYQLYSGTLDPAYIGYYKNGLTNSNTGSDDFWVNLYPIIYVANEAIQGLTNNTSLSPAVQQQLMGEALFVRSFCYFYLVNLYGDVPLVIGTDYKQNDTVSRIPAVKIWSQIIADLQNAQNLLSTSYLDGTVLNGTSERTRPTKWAASALLSRVYLYNNQWTLAATEADSVINNTSLFSLDTLNGVFLSNSTEAIWQIQPTIEGINTQDAQLFILPSSGPSQTFPITLSSFLMNAFEPGDLRRVNWVDSVNTGDSTYYYAYKYKIFAAGSPVTEYQMVLRLGEQYLIRAESEAQLGDLPDAISDLNIIRTRAGGIAALSTSLTQSQVIAAVAHERQVELFSEWGNRWLDLKRSGQVNAVMGNPGGVCSWKGGNWSSDWQWYPIQLAQLQLDQNLVQSLGY